jgi:hypothetical protein
MNALPILYAPAHTMNHNANSPIAARAIGLKKQKYQMAEIEIAHLVKDTLPSLP